MSNSRKGLPEEIITFIKTEEASYTRIQEKIMKRWKIRVAKSTVGYYKRQKPRIKPLILETVPQEDWHWFQGLFSADGNKIVSKDWYGKHYIIRISLGKKHDFPVAEKSIRVVEAMGLKPTVFSEGNCLRVKISSKSLFNALTKTTDKSITTAAYVAGAIDGDGWIDKGAIQFGQSSVPELFDAITDFFKEIGMPVATWYSGKNYRRMYISYPKLKLSGVLRYSLKAQIVHRNPEFNRFVQPSHCTTAELEDFYRLVLRGGKVETIGLKDRIRRAKLLAFHYDNEILVGIAAIKLPGEAYKRRVFMQAATSQESAKYGLELGWAFTLKTCRNKHICSRLVQEIVKMCTSHNIFATTETTNLAMQRVLERNGFQKAGKPYKGRLGAREYFLQLFTRSNETPI